MTDLPGTREKTMTAAEVAAVMDQPVRQPGDVVFGKNDGLDSDMVVVSLTSGVRYRFTATAARRGSASLGNMFLRLNDTAGTFIAENDDYNFPDQDAQIEFTPASSGLYVLRVSEAYFNTNGFLLTIEGGIADGLDANPVRPLASYAGTATAVLHGRDSGAMNLSIGVDGAITGSLTLASSGATALPVSGRVQAGGSFRLSADGGLAASGYIGPQGDLSGSWATSSNPTSGASGGLVIGERVGARVLGNRPPAAVTASAVTFTAGRPIALQGNASDPDADALQYCWKILSKPIGSTASFSDAMQASPTFVSDLPGDYEVAFTVSDGRAETTVRASLRSVWRANKPPVVSIAAELYLTSPGPVTLNALRTADPDGDPLTYHWEIVQQPRGTTPIVLAPEMAAAVRVTFEASAPGVYVARLTVSDGQSISTATVDTMVRPPLGAPPVAQGPRLITAGIGNYVTIRGKFAHHASVSVTESLSLLSAPAGSPQPLGNLSFPVQATVAGLYTLEYKVTENRNPPGFATDTVVVEALDMAGTWSGPLGLAASNGSTGTITFRTGQAAGLAGMFKAVYKACGVWLTREVPIFTETLLTDFPFGQSLGFDEYVKVTSASGTQMTGTYSAVLRASPHCADQTVVLPWTANRL